LESFNHYILPLIVLSFLVYGLLNGVAVFDVFLQGAKEGLSTAKQIARLERYGFQNVGAWSFEQANNMIARIAAQGWRRVPPGVNPREYVPVAVYGT